MSKLNEETLCCVWEEKKWAPEKEKTDNWDLISSIFDVVYVRSGRSFITGAAPKEMDTPSIDDVRSIHLMCALLSHCVLLLPSISSNERRSCTHRHGGIFIIMTKQTGEKKLNRWSTSASRIYRKNTCARARLVSTTFSNSVSKLVGKDIGEEKGRDSQETWRRIMKLKEEKNQLGRPPSWRMTASELTVDPGYDLMAILHPSLLPRLLLGLACLVTSCYKL